MNQKWMTGTILFLVAILAFLLWFHSAQEKKEIAERSTVEEQISSLKVTLQQKKNELSQVEKEYAANWKGVATEEFLLRELNEAIYTSLYPLLEEVGGVGILTLRQGEMLGQEGKLTRAQFEELLAAGWSYCLYYEGETELSSWISEQETWLQTYELSLPTILYFAEGTYSTDYDSLLEESGFTTVIHHGEEDQDLVVTEAEEGLRHYGATSWNQTGIKSIILNFIELGGNQVFTISFTDTDDVYTESGFISMLEYIEEYLSSGELLIGDFALADACRDAASAEKEAICQEYEEQIEALEKEIESLNFQINALCGA